MNTWIGFLINLQFFTVFPIRKQLPMDKKYIHRAIQTFPLVGLLLGLILAGVLYGMMEWTPFSSLVIAFVLWFLTIALTGGLHLDGWIDASDAFFSYQDKERRLEIMKDSRTGAFGVISSFVLLASRFIWIYEIVERTQGWTYFLIIMIPMLSKCVMGYLLSRMHLAKSEGLGAFFQAAVRKNSLYIYWVYIIMSFAVAYMIDIKLVLLFAIMAFATLLFIMYARRKILRWFGGITGDVLGASVEGVEVWLWLILCLLHYFAMG